MGDVSKWICKMGILVGKKKASTKKSTDSFFVIHLDTIEDIPGIK